MFENPSTERFTILKGQVLQIHPRFKQFLDAAESDTYEIWEMRKHWQRFQMQASELTKTIEHCGQSIVEIQSLQISPMLNNLDDFFAEIVRRLES